MPYHGVGILWRRFTHGGDVRLLGAAAVEVFCASGGELDELRNRRNTHAPFHHRDVGNGNLVANPGAGTKGTTKAVGGPSLLLRGEAKV